MFPLIVLFDDQKQGKILFEHFLAILQDYTEDYYVFSGEKLSVCENEPKFVVCKGKMVKDIVGKNVLIICDETTNSIPEISNCDNATVILNSRSGISLTGKQAEKCKFITYGFCTKDTVTLSSIADERAVVSIQRSFLTYSGRKIEPMEILIDCVKNDENNLLAIATALVYCEININ
ncbi:MAG: hypothetical protein RSD67_05045 [Oscillospiraceae bacterium]